MLVPLSSCDEAAIHLVKALGGESKAREVVGGVKWWQVRGIEGCAELFHFFLFVLTSFYLARIDAQWITAKKDWREAKRRHKMRRSQMPNSMLDPQSSEQPSETSTGGSDDTYEKYMDEMRCILYIHGGEGSRFVSCPV